MSWRALLVLAFALARAGAAPAAASPSLVSDMFVRFCGDTNGEAEAALQRADAAGWAVPPPMALTFVPFGSGKWIELRGRWSRAEGVLRILQVGTIRDPDGKEALVCTVAETPSPGSKTDISPIMHALQLWVGGPPLKVNAGNAIFAYRLVGGRRVPLSASQDPFAGDAVRTHPEMILVSLADVFGITPTITFMRWR
jgi:hypothetical protein